MATKSRKSGTSARKAAGKTGTEAILAAAGKTGKDEAAVIRALYSRASGEDLKPFTTDELAALAVAACTELKQHRQGKSEIKVDAAPAITRSGEPVSVSVIVNDNMPFLFDSVLHEIADSTGSVHLVLHPVLHVTWDKGRIATAGGDAGDRVSLVVVVTSQLSPQDAAGLSQRLAMILSQVRNAVAGWRPMLLRLDRAIGDFKANPPNLSREQIDEAVAFLEWLRDDNFTFLGMREYAFTGPSGKGELVRTGSDGLGILSDPGIRVLRRGGEAVTTTPEIRAFLLGPEPLIVTKANAKSVVHRRGYMDYVGIKTFDEKGKLTGELRIVGLFTSTAYTRSVMRIPYLRSKAAAVIRKSGHSPQDHSGKALINVLESYPRDELFQIDVKTLARNAEAIMALDERPRIRALVRADPFDRFVSVIVYVPRDRYDSEVRERIGGWLKNAFEGRLSAYYPAFPEGMLARVHFIIGRSGGKTPKIAEARIEEEIARIVRTWDDDYADLAAEDHDHADLRPFGEAFPETYKGTFDAITALSDARRMAALSAENAIDIDFYHRSGAGDRDVALKIYHYGSPVALSERVPLLENLGFRVISERTFEIGDAATSIFIHDMELETVNGARADFSDEGALYEDAFLAVWHGEADNDRFNRLVLSAGLDARSVVILRAYARYMQQAGIAYSQEFIADALDRYPAITRDLHALFCARFDPQRSKDGKPAKEAGKIDERIDEALNAVPNLDDDTIFRRFRNLIGATLRTNAWAEQKADRPHFVLAYKLDPKAVDGLPSPRPWREIFVYGPDVEGVHLRFGPVARGGLRWSDRGQDYRTEVLGLVKAQQVKNAVIVPVGAKGGFFPKRLPRNGSRDEVFAAGRAAYITFISSLLSVTDNLDGDAVRGPELVVRHDGDDPYFVVAADKGTATFSDTANAISADYGFWLDDAFASGGSAGYDHKKMGITARGAWEAVKRHFREMDTDIQTTPFTVVGVGDMSGDVFGNGMLLSEKIRLVAAFDHRDIFIDPDPDPAASYKERKRMFGLARSSWQDYDTKLVSKGGGVFSRSAKTIALSKEAQAAIGLSKANATPQEIMTAILKADVDLLWFGGIGTYVRATTESNQEAGDKANDAIRITAPEVRASVIGEGANLGVTQKARIEYNLGGGRCNSDAVDNSAGVNSSDVEVNIKIALAAAMRSGRLPRAKRDKLLSAMTDEVAQLVLANNYEQTLAISLVRQRGLAAHANQARFMSALESQGLLDREVENLPSDLQMSERAGQGAPLTRAEIGVLVAYAKIDLFARLTKGRLVDDPWLSSELHAYFPARMTKDYAAEIDGHRLRREIIATRVANDIVNRCGPSFVSRVHELTGLPDDEIARAVVAVRDGFELDGLYAAVDALDNKLGGEAQNRLYGEIGTALRASAAWMARTGIEGDLKHAIGSIRKARAVLEPKLARIVPEFMAGRVDERRDAWLGAGAPAKLAGQLALLPVAALIPEIALAAHNGKADLQKAAETFFAVTALFRIGRIEQAAQSISASDYYDGLALRRAHDMIGDARRAITERALARYGKEKSPAAQWLEADRDRIERARLRIEALVDSGDLTLSRLTVAAGLLGDLASA